MRESVETIKKTASHSRMLLAGMGFYAYQQAKNNKELSTLGFKPSEANKYQQYQFFFDPAKGYSQYSAFLTEYVQDKQITITPQQVFEILAAEHPLGIEILIYPDNAKKAPLMENAIATETRRRSKRR